IRNVSPGRRPRRITSYALALLVTALGTVGLTGGAVAAPNEYEVKAAFLYKFLGYIEFPASAFAEPASPVVIGVVNADDLAAELARIVNGRTVMGRPVQVKVLKETDAPANVHLLFIGGADSSRARAMLRLAKDSPMLVVTEADDGLASGSVINFKIVDERVRFDVSLEAADKNSVKLSSRLLTVANQVHKGAP
ncbi:MAG: YfiR family protein, partial [Gammaproteobacteria bacterium]